MTLNAKKSTAALLALAVSAFAIGTTEFISVGLLPLIADDLHITESMAGLTVTLYALGVMAGAPILTSLAAGVPRKTLLLWIMTVFIAGNILASASGGVVLLLVARVLSAFAHGVFMSVGSTIAADLVPRDRRASAISTMFSGLTIATVTGVPLGTLLGQHLGWRAAFAAIAAVGIAAFAANLALVPSGLRGAARTKLRDQLPLLGNRRLLLAFSITALGYGGTFVVFTYLSPLLRDITGFGESSIALILLFYGIAIAAGNVVGGKAANKRPVPALLVMFALQAVVLLALNFAAPYRAAGLAAVLLMGLLAFMNVPGLQLYVVMLAERHAKHAVDFASSLNIAAFNAGIAIGAFLGGIVVERLGVAHTPWVGALMVAAAVLLTAASLRLENAEARGNNDSRAPAAPVSTN
ncbi:MFS transporter [Cohnella rhizosphaerae]|uniref:MFS transporter n=1 Tax=Cohnella rhizosphaerae TaxID=1457232 RepID=A0A9X4KV41_9BACL|nr:MFS transporter [Cohnella rhizosphaerae]MDG0811472.1 MFS transporter [Cohnella rhizosphaerae]